MRFRWIALHLGLGLLCSACLKAGTGQPAAPAAHDGVPTPPIAHRAQVVLEQHGEQRLDEFAWLRNRDSSEVRSYLEAENAYTRAMMRSTERMQERLLHEFRSRTQPGSERLPNVRRGGYEYYSRVAPDKPYPVYCRKRASEGAAEEVLLDLNELAQGDAYVDLGSFEVSDDGNWLAYSIDALGARSYTLYVKDLRSGQLAPERIRQVAAVAWATDRTLFYTLEDEAKRAYRVYRHTLGETLDDRVMEERDPRYSLQVSRSRSGAYVFLTALSDGATEVSFVPAREPERPPQVVAPRRERHRYQVEHRGDWFFIRTNDRSTNFRLVIAPVANPSERAWRELRAASDHVALEELAVFRDYLVLHEREAGLPQLRIGELGSAATKRGRRGETPTVTSWSRVAMPEPVYELNVEENASFDAPAYRFSYESLTAPATYYDYRIRTRSLELVQRTLELPGYDPNLYREERLTARTADGTEVPISLVYRADKPPGPRPMLLEAYGAYGYPFPTTFSSTRVSLLDRGFIHAIAHVRGGGELGQAWHDSGRLLKKRNAFEDFIAAAEHLIGEGYTTSDGLAVEGASAGGLLIAAALNERPELFKAALLDVPFVDVLNTLSDPDAGLTDAEYEEWGDPGKLDDYRYIKSYCPYSNIQRADYPTLLVKGSYDDSEVPYWQPAKYVAKLRAKAASSRPVLLWVNLDTEREPSADAGLRERAFDYAFLLTQVGRPHLLTARAPLSPVTVRASR